MHDTVSVFHWHVCTLSADAVYFPEVPVTAFNPIGRLIMNHQNGEHNLRLEDTTDVILTFNLMGQQCKPGTTKPSLRIIEKESQL